MTFDEWWDSMWSVHSPTRNSPSIKEVYRICWAGGVVDGLGRAAKVAEGYQDGRFPAVASKVGARIAAAIREGVP